MKCIMLDCNNDTQNADGICAACWVDINVELRMRGEKPLYSRHKSSAERAAIYEAEPDSYEFNGRIIPRAKSKKIHELHRPETYLRSACWR
jgi:hypothetical protein